MFREASADASRPAAILAPMRPLRIAVLVKQVPRFETMELGTDGRLRREGVELELNPYCRRAVSKGVELARSSGGVCTVITLGPPSAEDCLREAIAWGADSGVLVSDPAFAGSDTLATSRALAAAVRTLPPQDLILAGRNSVDADTAQVPAEVAELLGLPFLGGVRELDVSAAAVHARCEQDDGWLTAEVGLPAVLSCAERLCEPAKVDGAGRAAVAPDRMRRLAADDLGSGPWGQEGSPTWVRSVRNLAIQRLRIVLDGDVDEQVRRAVDLLDERGALHRGEAEPALALPEQRVAPEAGPVVAVLVEPRRSRLARELLGVAARLSGEIGGSVAAVGPGIRGADRLARWGADRIVSVEGVELEEDVAHEVASWCRERTPWAALAPSTMWGREVAARVAARLGAGLVGDAVDLDVHEGRLISWKPAFGGGVVAGITCATDLQMVTVRPGVFALPAERVASAQLEVRTAVRSSRVRALERTRDDDLDALATAGVVVTVGSGVPPEAYPSLRPLLDALGAEMAATRRVTDKGWLPRSRQIGLTGRAVAPRLCVEIGVSGKFNHAIGLRAAGFVLAINSDPSAPIFEHADAGIVADWTEAVPRLAAALAERKVAPAR
jgi:electron transfer flavoprotein alpha subunit